MINYLKSLSYEDLKSVYKEYLSTLNISKLTRSTASTDAFYLWRHGSKELFWEFLLADDFEKKSKTALAEILHYKSKGNAESAINSYYSHLKRFREFVFTKSGNALHSIPIQRKTHQTNEQIPAPCADVVEEYLVKWNKLENYHLQENALNKLFHQLCPKNEKMEDVLLKCATLNDFYSTNIFSIYLVAKHIVNLDIDQRLQNGDITLVNEMQHISISGKVRNFYSFATKYCSHHNAEDFPIYDSYVEQVLFHFQKEHGFSKFKLTDLKDYTIFKSVLVDFRNYYGLVEYSLKQIDQYLWQFGKEYFPKKYK